MYDAKKTLWTFSLDFTILIGIVEWNIEDIRDTNHEWIINSPMSDYITVCLFGVIFVFIFLISALFSCLISVIGRSSKSDEDFVLVVVRHRSYSEECTNNSNLLY